MNELLSSVTVVAAQSRLDGDRYLALGLPADSCFQDIGNVKYDMPLPEGVVDAGKQLRAAWGANRPVWIAASTHAGEENTI